MAGLPSEQAQKRLIEDLQEVLQARDTELCTKYSVKAGLWRAARNPRNLAAIGIAALLYVAFGFTLRPDYIVEASLVAIFLVFSVYVDHRDRLLRHMVSVRRAREHLRNSTDRIKLLEVGHEVLTKRDGAWEFVPQNMLVRGDVIMLPQGATLPAKVTAMHTEEASTGWVTQVNSLSNFLLTQV